LGNVRVIAISACFAKEKSRAFCRRARRRVGALGPNGGCGNSPKPPARAAIHTGDAIRAPGVLPVLSGGSPESALEVECSTRKALRRAMAVGSGMPNRKI